MYVRLTHFTLPPEKVAEIKKVYYDEVAPVIEEQPGIVNVLLLEPVEESDEFISCTIWNSEPELKAFESGTAYQKVFSKIKEAATQPPYQKYYNTRA